MQPAQSVPPTQPVPPVQRGWSHRSDPSVEHVPFDGIHVSGSGVPDPLFACGHCRGADDHPCGAEVAGRQLRRRLARFVSGVSAPLVALFQGIFPTPSNTHSQRPGIVLVGGDRSVRADRLGDRASRLPFGAATIADCHGLEEVPRMHGANTPPMCPSPLRRPQPATLQNVHVWYSIP